eukprot:1161163-Pelagomonas_calceolata.AAC.6
MSHANFICLAGVPPPPFHPANSPHLITYPNKGLQLPSVLTFGLKGSRGAEMEVRLGQAPASFLAKWKDVRKAEHALLLFNVKAKSTFFLQAPKNSCTDAPVYRPADETRGACAQIQFALRNLPTLPPGLMPLAILAVLLTADAAKQLEQPREAVGLPHKLACIKQLPCALDESQL